MEKDGERWYPGKVFNRFVGPRFPSKQVPSNQPFVGPIFKEDLEPAAPINSPRPQSGRSFKGQSDESYCVECIEGHTMLALTEMRHALDRYRTAGQMTPGVSEKVKVALSELMGIEEDAKNLEGADPKVRAGINSILNDVRWLRKEYGVSGVGLTIGMGTEQDLMNLRNRIQTMQNTAYELVKICPTCNPKIQAAMGAAIRKREETPNE
jgi:hypothetical protein